MTKPETQVEFLAKRCAALSEADIRILHAKAMGASAIHQAGGRFYMAELCEDRANDLLKVLDRRVPA